MTTNRNIIYKFHIKHNSVHIKLINLIGFQNYEHRHISNIIYIVCEY